jgi:hypothetical protein
MARYPATARYYVRMKNETFAARLYVEDLEEAKVFFRDVLRMPVEDDGTADGYLVFTAPGGKSVLIEKATTTSADSVSSLMDDAEAKISAMEARAAAFDDLQRDKVAEAAEKRHKDQQVEAELAALKEQAASAKEGVARVKLVIDQERKLLPALRPRVGEANLPKRLET